MKEAKSTVAAIIATLPQPDDKGMLSKIDKAVVDKMTQQIYEGGEIAILALIDMLIEPAGGDHYKPHYALHCLALHACEQDRDEKRKFAQLLADQINGDRPKPVRAYLIRELQTCAGRSVCEQLGQAISDPDLIEDAVQALVAIGGRTAAEQIRNALPNAKGAARLTIIQNLAVLADEQSVQVLTAALKDDDREIRLAAASGLAEIADPASVDALLKLADTKPSHERTKATQACLVLAENLTAAGKPDGARIYKHLAETRTTDDEAYVRDAAKAALAR